MPFKVTLKNDPTKAKVTVDTIDPEIHNHVTGKPFSEDALAALKKEGALKKKS